MSFKVKTDETISTVRSQSNSTPPVSVQLLYDLDWEVADGFMLAYHELDYRWREKHKCIAMN